MDLLESTRLINKDSQTCSSFQQGPFWCACASTGDADFGYAVEFLRNPSFADQQGKKLTLPLLSYLYLSSFALDPFEILFISLRFRVLLLLVYSGT